MSIANRKVYNDLQTNPNAFYPVGEHTQDTTISAATVVTVPDGANGILVQCTGSDVRFTVDGTTPTTSKGFVMTAGNPPLLLLKTSDDCVFTFIEEVASAVLEYQAVRVYGSR